MHNLFTRLRLHFNKWAWFLVSPFMIALYVFVIILLFMPNYFKQFSAEIVNKELRPNFDKTYYYDLNSDGLSERISVGYNNGNKVVRIQHLNQHSEPYNQWRLPGKWLRRLNLTFGDYNHNGFAEIYCLTLIGDSIFLHIKELMLDGGIEIKNIFVCKAGTFDNNLSDIADYGGKLMDINSDGFEDYIFVIHAGYSKFPRNTFVYDVINDSISMSPQSASGIGYRVCFMDINGDGIDEITGRISSPENIHYPLPYTDSCAWLMVIDPKTMNFSFPPVKFDAGIGSYINPVFCKNRGKKYIAAIACYNSAKKSKGSNDIMLFDTTGKCLKVNEIDKSLHKRLLFFNPPKRDSNYFYLIDNYGSIYKTDTSLKLQQCFALESPVESINEFNYGIFDADCNGDQEAIFIGRKYGKTELLIYNSDLNNCTVLPLIEGQNGNEYNIELIKNGDSKANLISLQIENTVFSIKYGKSNFYPFKYPAYILIYLLLFGFFTLLQSVQNKLAQRRFENEKLLMRQQLVISKNQLEPHFMLNTLNGISYMFANEDKEKAQYYFGKFASLIKRGLTYADKTETTLKEELEFVRDYLVLQERRYTDLSFNIESEEKIDLNSILIPHSLVYTFSENALKHGLFHKQGKKNLNIKVVMNGKMVQITIKDNGIGRKHSVKLKTRGTGKGLHIVTNILVGYNKLNSRNISYKIIDLLDEDGNGVGTEVSVVL